MALNPESRFEVFLDGDDVICRAPAAAERRLRLADLSAVYFETSEGPFDADWWILEGGPDAMHFPLGARGESVILDRLKQLPGFEVRGMNSVKRERFPLLAERAR